MDEEELFNQALSSLDSGGSEQPSPSPDTQQVQPEAEDKSLLQRGADAWKSMGAGVGNALIETKDFLVGEPEEADKSQFRKDWEARSNQLKSESAVNSVAMGISQITTGLIGAGKLMAPIKAVKAIRGGKAAFEVGRGALAGTVVVDPHEERLSNLIEEFPVLQNPVTEYLAASPDDSSAEGRFKNALEGIGVDIALMGAIKAIKYMRSGDQQAALKEIRKLEAKKPSPEGEAPSVNQATPAAESQAVPGRADELTEGAPSSVQREPGVGDDLPGAQPGQAAGQEREVFTEQIGSKVLRDETGKPVIPTAEQPPSVIRSQDITDDQMDAILKGAESDTQALKQFGSVEAAIENGHKFAKEAPLPWQKLRGTEETMAFVRRSAEVLESRFNTAKGGSVLSDKRVKDLADDLARTYNEDPAVIIGQISEAGSNAAQMVSHMEAGLRIGNKMFLETNELANKIRLGQLDEFGGNLQAAQAELKARLAATIDVMSSANSVLANSGRALRRARSEFSIRPAELDALKDMDPEKIVTILDKAGGDPAKIMLLANRRWAERVMDETSWHLTNGLLWWWPTHAVNMTTNALMLAARPTEKLFGSSALRLITKDAGKRAELSTVSRQALKEYGYMVTSLSDGWSSAVEAFRRGDSILSPHNTEYVNPSSIGISPEPLPWKQANSIIDVVHNAWMSANYRNIIGLPTRMLGGADEFFKTLRYRGVIQARAALEAADKGLSPAETSEYIKQSLNKAIDPVTGRALDAAALRESQIVSFQQDLNYETTFGGSIGMGLTNLRKSAPITAIVLPFVKTPVNVIRYGIKMTPGLNILQKEFRDALRGKVGQEAQAHAVGQMAMGSLFSGLAASMVLSGRLTGAGPDDPLVKRELMASGWRPYSFIWEDDEGNKKYFQLGRFDPIGMTMGLVADVVGLMQSDPDRDWSDAIGAVGIAVAKNLGEKSFLLNLNTAIEAMMDPEKRLGKWAGNTVGGMIPGSALLRGANPDPYLREARTFLDNIKKGIPGASTTLPKRFDVFGEPVERSSGLIGTGSGDDLVEAEHNRIILQTGKSIGQPDPKIDNVDLRDIPLKSGQNAYERLQELSGKLPGYPPLKKLLEKTIKSELYQDMPDGDAGVKGTRLNRLGAIVQDYREKARKHLLRENPELQPYVKARQKEAAGAIITNRQQRQQGQPGASELLDALGASR
ncbi:hypothetical protein [Brucella intermedia]|uniref:hypothetical protein n=1 Tax=Brucella intermedia TaxID=94625 RepID=UPI00224B7DF8|nr:hypothetical protein [Brucella intermedia]